MKDKEPLVRRDILFVFCGIWFCFNPGGYLRVGLYPLLFDLIEFFLVFFCVITLLYFCFINVFELGLFCMGRK